MTQPPQFADRNALARQRARARHAGAALFLHEQAADEIEERLAEVNRRFTAPAVITAWPEFWQGILPGARIVGDDEVLALAPGAHDLVIDALTLHWANDPVGRIIQSRHALAPDGLYLAALLGGRTLAELRVALAEAEVALTGGLSPRVAPMAEIRDLGALLQRAGLALPVADAATLSVSYRDMTHLMRDLRAMGEANALALRPRGFTRASIFAGAARIYAENFRATPGPEGKARIAATFEMIFLTGWAPDPGQQQPLRPGSAAARLADALGTAERPAGEKPGR